MGLVRHGGRIDTSGCRVAHSIDHVRANRWAELLALQPALERDSAYWVTVWGPACAVAAYHQDRPDARELLVAVINAGFHDFSLYTQMFADTFATQADWPQLPARMEANRPPAPVELTEWLTAVPVLPVLLDRLDPGAEATLARRVPSAQATAQETALEMLTWVPAAGDAVALTMLRSAMPMRS
jgi:hypothetical protein